MGGQSLTIPIGLRYRR